ncbi:D-lactate dehydrogenase [Fructilactobacillus lindneri]|uniref:Quinone-dependent D-lactate dehydrogenase n=2 Tax=Fructilactobacillus lindneri TaxID=53444 RepID=A0A0R2JWY3_9LACO|nr:D-lactate dehydrogenase [Fructilactobacillus lindneri]ANZ57798.1 D-lactate dehydrogenase [Fructilactobacillus lindneri]ANZ59067.1 D-lactate dehydrogenase [Fructilactobacillus lindneri]KRN78756.1 D-lactate dehydrogenase [Fructilactobacillus lindneri DSM 20690 = JCM 11027]POG98121.1 D-lactate dehydrogenase [Fructilactobacillus lindneri]POH01764.1 D-lactate dehydrogenase [Fructilactobacillus lindneri]
MSVVKDLKNIVGANNVITSKERSEPYREGYRSGHGNALAVVRPKTLLELWQIIKIIHKNNLIVIMQAANTGLTEGSVPTASGYDRNVIVINTMRIKGIQLIDDNQQVITFPGTTLHELEGRLDKVDRDPHSVIGSSNIGATVIGGINNNSGGALIQRGPAYTELSLYAQIDKNNDLHLVNHLGIDLGKTPEEILTNLENHNYSDKDINYDNNRVGHNRDYEKRVRDVNADSPTRYNADPQELYEVSGSAGKLVAFAVRLNTYPKPKEEKVFYIGTNDPSVLEHLRRHILTEFKYLPVSGEYMHREAYDLAKKYGKDSLMVIDTLGTKPLPFLFHTQAVTERILHHVPTFKPNFTDRMLQNISRIFPDQLPKRMERFRNQYAHYLQLKVADQGINETRQYLKKFFQDSKNEGIYFECTPKEAKVAATHRYVAAAVPIRYQKTHPKDNIQILPLDIALPRNETNWFEKLPKSIDDQIQYKLYYGHFLDHVMHQDYILKKGVDAHKLKTEMLKNLDKRGALYPAEHNVGHLYHAPASLVNHYKENDPTNTFNPGIGMTSTKKDWK